MRRPAIFAMLFLLVAAFTLAQPGQPPPIQPTAPPDGPGGGPPGAPPIDTPVETPVGPPIDAPVEIPEETPEVATPAPLPDDILLLIDARLDLENLATETIGAERPELWSGTLDTDDPQFALLIRFDLELLAGRLLGAEIRPDGWFGVVASSPYYIARDIRHDLELLVETVVGTLPAGWVGGDPLMRCDRATQALVTFVIETNAMFTLRADRTAPDFCQQVTNEVTQFVEINYLSRPDELAAGLPVVLAGAVTVNNRFGVLFVDRGASARLGVLPEGTAVEPLGRSYAQFSNMMLVSGEGFVGFIDYQFTTLTADEFNALPDVESVEIEPFCSANWCDVVG